MTGNRSRSFAGTFSGTHHTSGCDLRKLQNKDAWRRFKAAAWTRRAEDAISLAATSDSIPLAPQP